MSANGVGVWGAEHHSCVKERLGRSLTRIALCEDLPSETNRVELSTTLVASGLAIPRITYRFDENVRRMMAFQSARAEESFRAAGAVHVTSAVSPSNAHLLGTARIGADPATSVVIRWGLTHDIPNLGIIDGSVLVTAGAVNPTGAIVALVLRTAQHLLDQRGSVSRPSDDDEHRPSHRRPTPIVRRATAPSRPLIPVERHRFERLADVLLPAIDAELSHSRINLGGDRLDEVLVARPDLAAALHEILTVDFSDATERVAELPAASTETFNVLALTAAGACYLDARVREAIGYPGQEPTPVSVDSFPDYVAEGLLDHMLA